MDWYWTRNLFEYRFPSVKTTDCSSSSWSFTSRRRWSGWILEIKRLSSERIWELSVLLWWKVEEQNGRRRRQQEKKSVLYWLVRTKISSSPSSSRSLRTQSHWSYTAGQCVDSQQFSSSAFIISDVQSIYTPSHLQDWYREDKFWARKDRPYSWRLWIPWIRIKGIRKSLTWPNHVLHRSSKSGKGTMIRCIGSIYSLLKGKDWSSIKQNVTKSSFTIHSQLVASRKICDEIWRIFYKKVLCHLDDHRRFPTKIIGCINWIQKSLEAAKIPNESNQHPKKTIIKNGETRMWARVHKGNRERYYVWSRGRQTLNKNGETREGGGARHWLQSTRIVTCSCERSRTSPSSYAC